MFLFKTAKEHLVQNFCSLILVMICTLLFACNGGTSPSNANGFSISNTVVEVGESSSVTATLNNITTQDIEITFSSSNTYLAVVGPSCTIFAGTTNCSVPVYGINYIGESSQAIIYGTATGGYKMNAPGLAHIIYPSKIVLITPELNVQSGDVSIITAKVSSSPTYMPLNIIFLSRNSKIAAFFNGAYVESYTCTIPVMANSCSALVLGVTSGKNGNSETTTIQAHAENRYIYPSNLANITVLESPTLDLQISPQYLTQGSSGTVTATLSNKAESKPVVVEFSTSNSVIARISESCTIELMQSSCSTQTIGISSGTVTLHAFTRSVTTVPTNTQTLEVGSAQGLTLRIGNPLNYNQQTTIDASIPNPVSTNTIIYLFTSDNTIMSVTPSCTILRGTNSCSAVINAVGLGAPGALSTISAASSGYISTYYNVIIN